MVGDGEGKDDRAAAQAVPSPSHESREISVFHLIAEHTPDHIAVQDRDLRYTAVINPQLGLTEAEMLGRTDHAFLAKADADRLAELKRKVIDEGQVVKVELPLSSRGGDEQIFDGVYIPIRGPDGTIDGLIGYFRNVTEERRRQRSLAQSDRLATVGLLAAGVAHEINNPLAFVLLNLDSMATDVPRLAALVQRLANGVRDGSGESVLRAIAGPDVELLDPDRLGDLAEQAGVALEGGKRIRDVARKLSIFSSIEGSDLSMVELSRTIEGALAMAHNEIRFRAQVCRQLRTVPTVLASESKLSQLFLNLLVNAAHAIDEGDAEHNLITVRTWLDGEDVCAEVADTGRGIPPEQLDRLFEPSFATRQPASGLGLTICWNIVNELGGRIQVRSEQGKGTSFVVRLPVGQAETPPPVSVGGAGEGVVTRGRILIVDDEQGIRQTLDSLLGRDHAVVLAASADEARALLEKDAAFDVVLCDVMMPGTSGVELHEWLTRRDADLAAKVLFMTGGSFTPRTSQYLGRPGIVTVEKPFDPIQLRRTVAAMVAVAKGRLVR